MQNIDDPWPLVCTKSSDARDVVGLVGGAITCLHFLEKNGCVYYGTETECNAIEFLQKNGD